MFENDYIMRMVSMLSFALARLMGLGKGNEPEAAEIIEDTCRELLGINSGTLFALAWSDLRTLAGGEGMEARARLRVMAHMLKAHGDMSSPSNAAYYHIKALSLYAFSLEWDENIGDEFMSLLRGCGSDLPSEVAAQLLPFLFDARELNLAEDIAFFALEDKPDASLISAIKEFYRKALALDDEELALCGFTRDEVEAGLKEAISFGLE